MLIFLKPEEPEQTTVLVRCVSIPKTTMATVVRIFPRRKAGESTSACPEKGREPLKFDVNSIQPLFALAQKDAARALGISLTALKKVCRKLGIHSWVQVRDVRAHAASPRRAPTPRGSPPVSRSASSTSGGSSDSAAHELPAPSICAAKAKAPASTEDLAGFIDALHFRGEGTPIPDGFDSDLMRDEPPSEDSDSNLNAQALLQSDVVADEDAGHERSHCTLADDLGFLVFLPAGPCLETSAPEPYSPAWLEWYATSVEEFRGGVM